MTELLLPDRAERDDLAAFAARLVRLDQTAQVRLRGTGDRVTAWAATPFDVLVTRSVRGGMTPVDVTVTASGLLTALAVDRADRIDPGPEAGLWAGELPPENGWSVVDDVPAAELAGISERGLVVAREHGGPLGPPASLLDQTVLTVSGGGPGVVKVPLRALFAMSGMGFLGGTGSEPGSGPSSRSSSGPDSDADAGTETAARAPVVRVSATGSWLRLDARYGAVVKRRITTLPLLGA